MNILRRHPYETTCCAPEFAACASTIDQYKKIGVWDGGIEIPRNLYEQSLNVFESVGAVQHRHPYETTCAPISL